MQCPRCYFSNPPGTRVCEYCGAKIEGTTDLGAKAGSSANKRKTMLGPPPSTSAPSKPPRTTRIDPEDPFRIAAQGVVTPIPPETAPPPQPVVAVAPPPPPAQDAKPPRPEPVRRQRPTLVSAPAPAAAVLGVALILPAPPASPHSLVLHAGRVRLGRRPEAEIHVQDAEASLDHAILRLEHDRAWLLDTSANGTLVDGVNCMNDRAEVSDGTVLKIGHTLVVVKLLTATSLAHLVEGTT